MSTFQEPFGSPKPLIRAPVVIKEGNDPITEDVLKDISTDLGEEWQKLAQVCLITVLCILVCMRFI